MGLRIGIDVGGTFTDFCVSDTRSGERRFFKTRSTPDDPPRAIANGIETVLQQLAADADKIDFLGHGTTTATNMIIERKGAHTVFLTTRGFRDVLELGRQARPHLYDYRQQRAKPLVRRQHRFEVTERLDAQGQVLEPLDPNEVDALAKNWRDAGIEAVAIGFLHAYRNGEHERQAASIIQAVLPDVSISISADISPEPREFERFSTTVANAFIAPRMRSYIDRLGAELQDQHIKTAPLTISSNGGLLDLETLAKEPVRTALSGPAAGVTGAARLLPIQNGHAISFDVGGTSTDIALMVEGQPAYTADREVAGLPLRTPMVDMEVIGAGGGSIARIDKGGALAVGPMSAGADPGPVAYGAGGNKPTLTDAAVTLGWLNPNGLLDGEVPLNPVAARDAIEEQIATPLTLNVEDAAMGIIRVAVANMARAIRSLGVRKAVDTHKASLLAYGGAGPLLAAAVAEELSIERILVPEAPGTMCAQAMLVSDMALDLTKSLFLQADGTHWPTLEKQLNTLKQKGEAWLERQNIDLPNRVFALTLEARYIGQNFEIQVAGNPASPQHFAQSFHKLHKAELGFALPEHTIEIITARLRAIGRIADAFDGNTKNQPREPDWRRAMLDGEIGDVAVWKRHALPQKRLQGPLIIEEMSTTTVVPAGWLVECEPQGHLCMQRTQP